MTTKTQAVRRSGPHFPIVLLSALGFALSGAGCTPDVPQEVAPGFVELQFDPSATPPLAYQPTLLVTNEETGLLDFAAAGIVITSPPPACQTEGNVVPLAACEFYWYMEQLDGFPTLTPGSTPVSKPIDVATVTVPGNLYVQSMLGTSGPVTDLTVTYEADTATLDFDPAAGWDIGALYGVAIRGYVSGIKDTAGEEAVKSIIYVLLSQDNPLTCGITSATDPALLSCEFYSLFSSDARFVDANGKPNDAAIFATLAQLEQLRELYKGQSALPFDLWSFFENPETADMPPDQVAILWAFRTHTSSVIELNPAKGLVPDITSPTEIRLKPKGPIQASTLSAFSLGNPGGTVILVDATAYLSGNLLAALPAFTVTYAEGDIVLTTDAALTAGDQYIIVVTNEVEGKPGVPIVPSPVTVFLRTRGELVDDFSKCASDPPTAAPLVPGLKSADACQLEAGRQQLKALLDAQTVIDITKTADRPNGLTREIVAYLFAFEYTAQ